MANVSHKSTVNRLIPCTESRPARTFRALRTRVSLDLSLTRDRQAIPMTDVVPMQATRPATTLQAVIVACRPKQWMKNGFVAAALIFSDHLHDPQSVIRTAWAVAIFCLISSAGYLVNDVVDVDRDRLHPTKRTRPVAAGNLTVGVAIGFAVALAGTGLIGAMLISGGFALVATAYAALTVTYTMILKRIFVIDVLAVASGFVLRAAAGAVAINVPMSAWLGVLTGMLALFIVLGKRRADREVDGPPVVAYDPEQLDWSLRAVGSAIVLLYAVYTLVASNLPRDHAMVLTVPLVAAGLWRYFMLVRRARPGATLSLAGAPEEMLLRDPALLLIVGAWVVTSLAILYGVQ
jgi:4-hydroxybenzoate polyprenyltransferase